MRARELVYVMTPTSIAEPSGLRRFLDMPVDQPLTGYFRIDGPADVEVDGLNCHLSEMPPAHRERRMSL